MPGHPKTPPAGRRLADSRPSPALWRLAALAVLAAALLAKRLPVGGQAVIEGVMMRGVSHWSLAVRRPDQTIHLDSWPLVSF